MTTIGLLRPTLLPGLTRLRRDPRTLQFGVDPGRSVLVDLPDDRAAAVLDLLDGVRTEREVVAAALRLGVRPTDTRVLLAALHANGLLLPAHTVTPPAVPAHLQAEVTAIALRQSPFGAAAPRTPHGRLGWVTPAVVGRAPAVERVGRVPPANIARHGSAASVDTQGSAPPASGMPRTSRSRVGPVTPPPAGRAASGDGQGCATPASGVPRTSRGRVGSLTPTPGPPPASGGRGRTGPVTPAQVLRRRAQARVLVAGRGRLATLIALTLAAAGIGHVRPDLPGAVRPEEAALIALTRDAVGRRRDDAVAEAITAAGARTTATKPQVIVQVGPGRPATLAAAGLARRGQAALAVDVRDGLPVVGPFVTPGGSPCLGCLDLHRADRDPHWPEIAAALATAQQPAEACDLVTIMAAAALAAGEVLEYVGGGAPTTAGAAVTVVSPGDLRRRDWPSHPRCLCVRGKL